VRDSDGTLILARGGVSGGTALTAQLAQVMGQPCRIVRLDRPGPLAGEPKATLAWIAEHEIVALNVAGPRESQRPGITEEARAFMDRLIAAATKT
jgi:hypothetical protein